MSSRHALDKKRRDIHGICSFPLGIVWVIIFSFHSMGPNFIFPNRNRMTSGFITTATIIATNMASSTDSSSASQEPHMAHLDRTLAVATTMRLFTQTWGALLQANIFGLQRRDQREVTNIKGKPEVVPRQSRLEPIDVV